MRFFYFFVFWSCHASVEQLVQSGNQLEITVNVPNAMSAEYVNILVELQESTATRYELIFRAKYKKGTVQRHNLPGAKNGFSLDWIGSRVKLNFNQDLNKAKVKVVIKRKGKQSRRPTVTTKLYQITKVPYRTFLI